jgi:hypothetical protein
MQVWTKAVKRVREHLVALFGFAVLLLTPPVLLIFNKPVFVLGIPALYLYLFTVWAVLIALGALAIEASEDAGDDARSDVDRTGGDAEAAARPGDA